MSAETSIQSDSRQLAQPPRPPAPSPGVQQVQEERSAYLREREHREKRSVWRGLIFLAAIALLLSLIRAGADRAFYPGWWRQW